MNERFRFIKMKNWLAAMAVVALVSLASAAPNDTGTIIVYRRWNFAGSGMPNWRFNVDHGPDLIVRNGFYRRLVVTPGDYIISHDHMFMMGQDEQKVHVVAGQTVYFQYEQIGVALMFEVADNQEKAARSVAKLRDMESFKTKMTGAKRGTMRKTFLIIAASLVLAATAWADPFPFHDIGSTRIDYADYGPYQRSSVIHGVYGKIDCGVVDVYMWSNKSGNTANTAVISDAVTIWVLSREYNGTASAEEWESTPGVYWLTGYGEAGTVCHIEGHESVNWRR